ncbi:MAG TPA: hypothetical protein VJZ77_05830 [Blastocatellia bacterium]|nr:hypothetical protein [Blastocatellia bacterium]
MRSILLTLAFALSVSSVALAQQVIATDSRAQDVIKQTRATIWDEAKSPPLQSLSINASRRFTRGERQVEVEMTLEALFPDKFLQTDALYTGVGFGLTTMRGVNGSQAWFSGESDASSADAAKRAQAGLPPESVSNQSGGMSAILGDLGGVAGVRPPEQTKEQSIHAGFARLMLVWLCATPSSLPVEFTYAGHAVAQVDGKKADVLNVTGTNNFAARLFIHPETRQVLMLSYKAGSRNRGQQEASANAAESEVRWVVSDYRIVDGLNLPHQLVIFLDGRPVEEVTIKKVKINPSLKPNKFERQEIVEEPIKKKKRKG